MRTTWQNMSTVIAAALLVSGCSGSPPGEPTAEGTGTSGQVEAELPAAALEPTVERQEVTVAFTITSVEFVSGGEIPVEFTCDGSDGSPALTWSGIPKGTQSLALIMDDPDAPAGTWDHWVLFNVPADMDGLPAGAGYGDEAGLAYVQGSNSWGRSDYGGPCPPTGEHRYFFRLYALDSHLEVGPGSSKSTVLAAMEGHVLGQAELMGRYSR